MLWPSKALHFKYTFKIYCYRIGTFCNLLCTFQTLNHFSIAITSIMWTHCTNALPPLLHALDAKKMNLYEVVWSPTLWGTGSEGSHVSMGGLGCSSDASRVVRVRGRGLRREVNVWVARSSSQLPSLAQLALPILHQWNISFKPSSLLRSHRCSLLCYFG